MATPKPKNTFPKFDDADVEIRLSTGENDIYRLHSFVLALHLPFFKASLSDRWAGGQELGLSEGKLKWEYELRFKGHADGILIRKSLGNLQPPEDTANDVSESQNGTLMDVLHNAPDLVATARQAVIYAHEQLFRLLYHAPSTISTQAFTIARRPIEDLYAIADMYGCTALVATHMGKHLQCFKNDIDLLRSCIDDIPSILDFSMKTRSAWIFRKAMVRLIGCPQKLDPATREACDKLGLKDLIEAKEAEFRLLLQHTEHQLFTTFGYGPLNEAENRPVAGLVRDFFREWFASKIRKGQGSGMRPGYAKVYRRLESVDIPARLKTEAFMKQHISCRVSTLTFEQALKEAFKNTAPVIATIMTAGASELYLYYYVNPKESPLTCINIIDDDLPWKGKPW